MNDSILTVVPENNQPRTVSRERNLDFGQLFYPQEKRKVFVVRTLQSEIKDATGSTQTIKAVVNYVPKYGTLTTFDERVYYVLVEIWEEQSRADVCFFSEREVAKRLGIGWSAGQRGIAKTIRDSLFRLRGVLIEWDGSFFHKVKNEHISITRPFTVLNHLELVDVKSVKVGSQVAEFGFDQMVIDNINSNYSRPVLLDQILLFESPLAQALYTYLEPRMYSTNHFHRTSYGLLVNDFGLVGQSYRERWYRVRAINRAREELVGKQFFYGECVEFIEVKEGKNDAVVHVYRTGANKIKGVKLAVVPPLLDSQQQQSKPNSKQTKLVSNQSAPRVEEPIDLQTMQSVAEVLNEWDKSESKTNAPESLQSASNPQPVVNHAPAPEKPITGASEPLIAVSKFYKLFHKQELSQVSKNDVSKAITFAENMIAEYSLEFLHFWIDFAYQESQKPDTYFAPEWLVGLKHVRAKALKAYQEVRRVKAGQRIQRQEQRDRDIKSAEVDHETEYLPRYHEYVDDLIAEYSTNHYHEIAKFREYNKAERAKVEAKNQGGVTEIELRVFDKEASFFGRMCEYFASHSAIKILTFEEWDKQINPHSFDPDKIPHRA